MAFSTLLVHSLRSPLFPVPMANPSWARGVKRSGPGGALLGSINRCSTFRSQVPETNGQNSRSVCTSTESVLIGSDAERKGSDDAMWEGDYDEPILSIQRAIRRNTPSTMQVATMNITGRRITAIGVLTVHTRKPEPGENSLTPKVQHGSEAPA